MVQPYRGWEPISVTASWKIARKAANRVGWFDCVNFSGMDQLAAATCDVFVAGIRKGSGTLVDSRHVLTASHVVGDSGHVEVHFAAQTGKLRLGAVRVSVNFDTDLDLSVLEVEHNEPKLLPPPAELWPWARLPAKVKGYGFPLAEGRRPRGVWINSTVIAGVRDKRVQLNWDDHGSFLGHSGGPIADSSSGAMVGVLVEGSEQGRFDRFVPLSAACEAWPLLRLPWGFLGEGTREHFVYRAMGQRSRRLGGDLFQGRARALARIREWLSSTHTVGLPLVVTGQPGAGKSAVVARAALEMELMKVSPGLAFHSRRATAADLADAVAAFTGLATPDTWQALIRALPEEWKYGQLPIVIDALDEAATPVDRRDLSSLIRELAQVDWIRVVVATRPVATGLAAYRQGSHLHSLGILRNEQSMNLIDLDNNWYFNPVDLSAYVMSVLSQETFIRPMPPGGAWETYRRDHKLRGRVADIIARRADRNYLVAAMAALPVSQDTSAVVDPSKPDFDPESIPASIGRALDKYIERLDDDEQRRVSALLTALAYGRGPGLDDQRWISFANAISHFPTSLTDVERLRTSAAADYLLSATADGAGLTTRLFHQALADELLGQRDQLNDERRLFALIEREAHGDWASAPNYVRQYGPSHAAAAGMLKPTLNSASFLAGASPVGIRSVIMSLKEIDRADAAAIHQTAFTFLSDDPGSNATYLGVVAATQGNHRLAIQLSELDLDRPCRVISNLRPFDFAIARFDAHTAGVMWVDSLAWPDLSHLVLVTASWDGTARVWDPLRPEAELSRFDRHNDGVSGVTSLAWPGLDHQVLVTISSDKTALVWDPYRPEVELGRFDSHTGRVRGVAGLRWPGLDHPVVATTANDGTVRIWDPGRPEVELDRFDGHTGPVRGVASLRWPGLDHPVVVTTSLDTSARIWGPHRREPGFTPFTGHTGLVRGAASLPWPHLKSPALVTTSDDGTARIWDPHQPAVELARFDGHAGPVRGVASLTWSGLNHPVLATTSSDFTARVWDPHQPDVELARFDGHTDIVSGAASLRWSGLDHPVLVTTSWDLTARVWDPHRPDVELARFDRHTDALRAVSALPWPGIRHAVLVTTSDDGTARVWDPRRPDVELARFDRHTDAVLAVSTLSWPGLDHRVLVTISDDGTARIWDPRRPDVELARFDRHIGGVWGVATLAWSGLAHDALATTSIDGTVRVWDPHRPDAELARLHLLGAGYALVQITAGEVAAATARGIVVLSRFRAPSSSPNMAAT